MRLVFNEVRLIPKEVRSSSRDFGPSVHAHADHGAARVAKLAAGRSEPGYALLRVVVLHAEVVPALFLLFVLLGVEFVDTGAPVRRVSPEGDLQQLQEFVHTLDHRLRRGGRAIHAGSALVNNNPICQIRRHDEIVLHDKRSLL